MPTFGAYQFTEAVNDNEESNDHEWQNTGNAVDSESITNASTFTDASAEDEFTNLNTYALNLSGFIPPHASATIDGVIVTIRLSNAQAGATWTVRCRKSGGTPSYSYPKTHVNNSSGPTNVTFGSPTDDWSNDGLGAVPLGFDGIAISCSDTADNYSTQDAKVYDAEISIAYTPPDKHYYGTHPLPDASAGNIVYGDAGLGGGGSLIKEIKFNNVTIWQDLNP